MRARDLGVTYAGADRPAFADVSFELGPGEVLLVVGPSGSGKSTLALTIAGLVPGEIPAVMTGTLEIDGTDVRSLGPVGAGARTGLVLQDPSAQLVMERAEDDVAFGLENRGWPPDEMHERVPEALDAAGLGGLGRSRSRRLSGGQQQRLALAGALAPRPGMLVLDEPTANLDPEGASTLIATLSALRVERAATIVLIEHQVDRAWPLADIVLALGADGRPIDVGAPNDVLTRSANVMRDAGIWLPAGAEPAVSSRALLGSGGATLGEVIVRADSARFGYDRNEPVVRDLTFDAAAGERIALVGPNGSGKSTLGRLLVGLLRPNQGTVRLHEEDPARMPAATLARHAGYVFQEPERQFLAQRVGDEVRLGLTVEEDARVDDLMDRLGLPLERFADRSPYRLSGGEQRRLSLACVLIRRPDVLVLDEPTFGSDRHGYDGLLGILGEHLDAGACLIAATHDRRFVHDVAHRVVEMDAGWIVRDEAVR
ncbi:MAG: ABC transporter ATP-binding protein [Candidatus Limnocylindrales bacterium]